MLYLCIIPTIDSMFNFVLVVAYLISDEYTILVIISSTITMLHFSVESLPQALPLSRGISVHNLL